MFLKLPFPSKKMSALPGFALFTQVTFCAALTDLAFCHTSPSLSFSDHFLARLHYICKSFDLYWLLQLFVTGCQTGVDGSLKVAKLEINISSLSLHSKLWVATANLSSHSHCINSSEGLDTQSSKDKDKKCQRRQKNPKNQRKPFHNNEPSFLRLHFTN